MDRGRVIDKYRQDKPFRTQSKKRETKADGQKQKKETTDTYDIGLFRE